MSYRPEKSRAARALAHFMSTNNRRPPRKSGVEILDLGPDHAQYFQGFGLGNYDDAAVGIGDNAKEAYDDAVEQLFMKATGNQTVFLQKKLPRRPHGISVRSRLTREQRNHGEWYWYVGVRVKYPRPKRSGKISGWPGLPARRPAPRRRKRR